MARSAVTITRKRAVWAARREVRLAEKAAHDECGGTPAFQCHAVSACGTGDCKFAQGDMAQLVVPAQQGVMKRQQAPYETYSPDEAVRALAAQRIRR